MPSYSTRIVFQWIGWRPEKKRFIYEERVTVWKARNEASAVKKAEAEAKRYAEQMEARYLGFLQVFWMFDEIGADGVEIYSLVRESDLTPRRYIRAHFDTGYEKEQKK